MAYIPIDVERAVRRECERRRFSPRTFKTYLYCINKFLRFASKELGKISKKDVRLFLEKLSNKGMSGNTLNTYHMAVRFLLVDVLDKRIWFEFIWILTK